MNRNDVARKAATDALVGLGLTRDRASLIVHRVEAGQPTYWHQTIDDCANGKSDHVYLFVRMLARYDPAAMSVVLYAGSNATTVAWLMADLQDNTAGTLEGEENPSPAPEPWRTACFDVGPELCSALRPAA
jgi:hypothetical protein